jgi:hypothetical protein
VAVHAPLLRPAIHDDLRALVRRGDRALRPAAAARRLDSGRTLLPPHGVASRLRSRARLRLLARRHPRDVRALRHAGLSAAPTRECMARGDREPAPARADRDVAADRLGDPRHAARGARRARGELVPPARGDPQRHRGASGLLARADARACGQRDPDADLRLRHLVAVAGDGVDAPGNRAPARRVPLGELVARRLPARRVPGIRRRSCDHRLGPRPQ